VVPLSLESQPSEVQPVSTESVIDTSMVGVPVSFAVTRRGPFFAQAVVALMRSKVMVVVLAFSLGSTKIE
jgi:hypothetical protein